MILEPSSVRGIHPWKVSKVSQTKMFGTRTLSQALVVESSISTTWITMTFVMQSTNSKFSWYQ